jgi:integrase/recombinase XerC
MGRPKKQNREPFWKADRNCYYVQHGTNQFRLAPGKDEAWRLWHVLMARKPEELSVPTPDARTVVEVLDLFLEWASRNRNRLTYEAYKRRLQNLADSIPPTLPHPDLKPYHLTRVTDAKGWNGTTKNDFLAAVQRAFNWALAEGIIDRHPLPKVKKPARQSRELAISPALYAEAMQAIKEPNFRLLLEFAWESGVRPQEIRIIEARHVDFEMKRVVLPPKEAKGRKRHRVIYLTDEAAALLAKLVKERPTGTLFRNSEDAPWTKDAINCAFCRLKEKIGKKLHLGAWRKGYATEAIKAGVDLSTLSSLMGHQDGRMLTTVYSKVYQDHEHMAEAARKAKAPRKS